MKKVTTNSISHPDPRTCPITNTMKKIGGKWKLIIIYYLAKDPHRFSELQRAIPEITTKMLTQQLRELEVDQVITRKVYPVIPPKVEYSLTKQGQKLLPIIELLNSWGEK